MHLALNTTPPRSLSITGYLQSERNHAVDTDILLRWLPAIWIPVMGQSGLLAAYQDWHIEIGHVACQDWVLALGLLHICMCKYMARQPSTIADQASSRCFCPTRSWFPHLIYKYLFYKCKQAFHKCWFPIRLGHSYLFCMPPPLPLLGRVLICACPRRPPLIGIWQLLPGQASRCLRWCALPQSARSQGCSAREEASAHSSAG